MARPRLLAGLTRKPSPRLALLRAPAGAGKTTLLAEWSASPDEQRPFAFLALDAGDNDPIRFWSYVIEALRGLAPHIGGEAVDLLRVPGVGVEDAVLPVLINDLLALDEALVLALDDYHVLRAPAVHHGLTFLIERGPPGGRHRIANRAAAPTRTAPSAGRAGRNRRARLALQPRGDRGAAQPGARARPRSGRHRRAVGAHRELGQPGCIWQRCRCAGARRRTSSSPTSRAMTAASWTTWARRSSPSYPKTCAASSCAPRPSSA